MCPGEVLEPLNKTVCLNNLNPSFEKYLKEKNHKILVN